VSCRRQLLVSSENDLNYKMSSHPIRKIKFRYMRICRLVLILITILLCSCSHKDNLTQRSARPNTIQGGIISGRICYPKDGLRVATIYARNIHTQELYSIHVENVYHYELEVPKTGNYFVFAWTDPHGPSGKSYGGMYSYAVTCKLIPGERPNHTPIPVAIKDGQHSEGIDICDFLSQENVPLP
jgi:hypothetical protein